VRSGVAGCAAQANTKIDTARAEKDPFRAETTRKNEMSANFKPRIIAFCCNWCAYAGADLAGVSRIQYPPNIRIVRVMCSGRISPDFILKALQRGADGVLVSG